VGKTAAVYTLEMRIRTSSINYCDTINIFAEESKVCRMNSELLNPDRVIAALIFSASPSVNLAERKTTLAFAGPTFGLPGCFFILIVTQIYCIKDISVTQ
jgi:hypothetical protein